MEYEKLMELLIKNRSYRRFDGSKTVTTEDLKQIVGLSILCASGRNLQPLKYRIVNTKEECAEVYPLLAWAGYLTDWNGPVEAERPTAYIVQCLDTDLTENPMCDEGLQLEAITLGAVSKNLGTCIIKSFNPDKLKAVLNIPANLRPTHVVALGYPVESVRIVPMRDGDIKYYRDAEGNHYVPKRGLEEILVK